VASTGPHNHGAITSTEEKIVNIRITSDAFREREAIPIKYTCDGDDLSPPLRWSGIPPNTKSLALICGDPDAPSGLFTHWVLYNLSATATELPEGVPTRERLSNGAEGLNDFERIGYGGPYPPPRDGAHRYFFRLYALGAELRLGVGARREDLVLAMEGHVLAAGHLMGTYLWKRAQDRGAWQIPKWKQRHSAWSRISSSIR
jgi:Raf kinase inhibitor-like YbhB/YbcL family protein